MGSYFSKKAVPLNKHLAYIVCDYINHQLPFLQELEYKTTNLKFNFDAIRLGYDRTYYYDNYYVLYHFNNFSIIGEHKSKIKYRNDEWVIEYI